MTAFPTSISFGYVVGRFLLAVADGTTTDGTPDPTAAVGTITLRPIATEILATGTDPAIVVPADVRCTLDASGTLTGPDGNAGVWVVTGEYTVVAAVQNAPNLPTFDIVVTETNTATAPLNLALAAPMTPMGQQVFVVNQQVYLDTLAARDAAQAAAAEAESYGASAFALLGLGSASKHAATDFDPAGAAAAAVAGAHLGTAATHAATDFDSAGAAAAAVAAANLGTAATHAATDFDPAGAAAAITPSTLGLGNVDNTHDLAKPISNAQAAVNAVKADLVGGVIPTSQIPALALTTSVVVASQSAMLALTAAQVQPGDLAVRTDGAGTFILTAADPSQLGNWQRLNAPTDVVQTVNGQQGAVVLHASDVGADPAGAATAAVQGLAPLASPAFTGTPTVPTAAAGTSNTQAASTAFVGAAIAPLAPLASPALTGTPTVPTAAAGTSNGQAASTGFVAATIAPLAPLASPALTGTPTVPTAAAGTSNGQAASTAFVGAAITAAAMPVVATVAQLPAAGKYTGQIALVGASEYQWNGTAWVIWSGDGSSGITWNGTAANADSNNPTTVTRQGRIAVLTLDFAAGSSPSNPYLNVPTGFRPKSYAQIMGWTSPYGAIALALGTDGNLYLRNGSIPANCSVYGQVAFTVA